MEQSVIVIQDDRGGLIGDYIAKLMQARTIHARVEIRGKCFSACTLLAAAPDVCVGPEAEFGFHSTSVPSTDGVLLAYYPAPIKEWLRKRGGLNDNPKFLKGEKLETIFKECD